MTKSRVSMAIAFPAVMLLILLTGCKKEPPKITIQDPRVEFSEVMRDEAAVYMDILNSGGPDRLLGATVSIPGAVAAIHVMRGDVMVIGKSLPIPEKNSLALMRIGPHIMITHLPLDTAVGSRFTITLQFERTGEVQVPLEFTKERLDPSRAPHATHQH